MLEPVMRPRTGRVVWVGVFLLAAGFATLNEVVVTRAGTFSITLAAAVLAAIAGVRAIGLTIGIRNGSGRMSWPFRILSWLILLAPLALMGALATPAALGVAGGLCALDAVGGLLAPKADTRPARSYDRFLARLKVPLLLGIGLVGLVLVHFLWASHVEGGLLIDWAYLCALFGLTLRYTVLPARRAGEEGALPAAEVRRHEPRARAIPDPARDAAFGAVAAFRKTGRVEPLLEFVRGFGVPGLEDDAKRLLSRAGTGREDDLAAVAALIEKRLSGATPVAPARKVRT